MKRILIIANTYYQLILAIQMQQTIYKNDEIVLLQSDHSKNTKEIVKQLNKYNIFSQSIFIKSKGIVDKRNFLNKFVDNCSIAFLEHNRYTYYLDKVDNKKFDELICYNYGIDTYGIYVFLYECNPNLRVSLFEEGILSYDIKITMNIQRKIIKMMRNIKRKKDISERLSRFYCFYPEIYQGQFSPVQVPIISLKGKTTEILKKIFEIKEEDLKYKQKYIFFSSVYDFEGEPIGEFELVKQIRDIVGNENLLIKMHPRDIRDIYEKNGFNIDRNSSIPWEVIQLSTDLSQNIFLTATSGSVLAGSFLTEKPIRTIYLYKLCDIEGNRAAVQTANNIKELLESPLMKKQLTTIEVANSIKDIL